MRVAIPARSRTAWDSRMGLFHCMAEHDGIEDDKKRPVQDWAAGENRLQGATARTGPSGPSGSYGIGFGGLDAGAALFWAFVGIPLAWGVWKTLETAVKIL